MILPNQINLAEIAFLQHQVAEEQETQARIIKARALQEGYFDSTLATATQNKLIGGTADDISGVNMCLIANRTLVRRVNVTEMTSPDEALASWMQSVWSFNQLNSIQRELHRMAQRDGVSFAIVDYDLSANRPYEEGAKGMPVITVHERYTDPSIAVFGETGNGEGCKAHWRNNDPNQHLEMVSKRWVQTVYEDGEPITSQRMTLYINKQPEIAARIEKFIIDDDGAWAEHTDQIVDESGNLTDEEWPIWWTIDQTEAGESMEIPVAVFRNESTAPGERSIWGLQAGMDQFWSMLLGTGSVTAHQLLVAIGFYPTTDGKVPADDGSNLMEISPRQILGTAVPKTKADMKALPPADLRPIIDGIDKIAMMTALVAGLPLKNFVFTRQVSSGKALQYGEVELLASANELIDRFEPTWVKIFTLARQQALIFGSESWSTDSVIAVQWSPTELVNQDVRIDDVSGRQLAGVDDDSIKRDVYGYTQAEIDAMPASDGEAATGSTEETSSEEPDDA